MPAGLGWLSEPNRCSTLPASHGGSKPGRALLSRPSRTPALRDCTHLVLLARIRMAPTHVGRCPVLAQGPAGDSVRERGLQQQAPKRKLVT